MDTYRKQYDLMNSICVLFEEEKADEGEEVKNGRFEKLLDLMQQVFCIQKDLNFKPYIKSRPIFMILTCFIYIYIYAV